MKISPLMVFLTMGSLFFAACGWIGRRERVGGMLARTKYGCSMLVDGDARIGLEEAFCRDNEQLIGHHILVQGRRVSGDMIGQDGSNRSCFDYIRQVEEPSRGNW